MNKNVSLVNMDREHRTSSLGGAIVRLLIQYGGVTTSDGKLMACHEMKQVENCWVSEPEVREQEVREREQCHHCCQKIVGEQGALFKGGE